MSKYFEIDGIKIGEHEKCFIIAEMSSNHLQDFDRAVEIIKKAKWAGADAIKIQTYTPDTITLDCDNEYFQIKQKDIFKEDTLHKLYQKSYTPWEWHIKLKEIAEKEGLVFFSTPFDCSSVDFLEEIGVQAYNISSFEMTDIPFIKYVASKGKPIMIATGIARLKDIQEALQACYSEGNKDIALLKCTSAYPAPVEDVNLNTMKNMGINFGTTIGLSDHTSGNDIAIAATAIGAKIIEKHLTLKRDDGGKDSRFSMEPQEFKDMVESIRRVEKALGRVSYDLTPRQKKSKNHSRSLFVVKDVKKGEIFTNNNVRSIRPGYGLETKYIEDILGKKSTKDIEKGTPMDWSFIEKK